MTPRVFTVAALALAAPAALTAQTTTTQTSPTTTTTTQNTPTTTDPQTGTATGQPGNPLAGMPPSIAARGAPVPDSTPVPPGIEVERAQLSPGEAVVFSFRPGKVHRLLVIKAQGQAAMKHEPRSNEVKAWLAMDNGMPKLTVANGTDQAMAFSMLTDFDGNGGFTESHQMTLPAKGSVSHDFKRSVAAVNFGNFDPA